MLPPRGYSSELREEKGRKGRKEGREGGREGGRVRKRGSKQKTRDLPLTASFAKEQNQYLVPWYVCSSHTVYRVTECGQKKPREEKATIYTNTRVGHAREAAPRAAGVGCSVRRCAIRESSTTIRHYCYNVCYDKKLRPLGRIAREHKQCLSHK